MLYPRYGVRVGVELRPPGRIILTSRPLVWRDDIYYTVIDKRSRGLMHDALMSYLSKGSSCQ